MKLFYYPGACSLSPHIVANEAGLEVSLVPVDLRSHTYEANRDYYEVNSRGYVPALMLETGEVLTEGPAIIQYLAHQAPDKNLLPTAGSIDYYRALEWIAFLNAEHHKTVSPLFSPTLSDETRATIFEKIKKNYAHIETLLAGKEFALGATFSVVDAYLFTLLRWNAMTTIDLSAYSNIHTYMQRVAERPAVQKSLAEEGLNA